MPAGSLTRALRSKFLSFWFTARAGSGLLLGAELVCWIFDHLKLRTLIGPSSGVGVCGTIGDPKSASNGRMNTAFTTNLLCRSTHAVSAYFALRAGFRIDSYSNCAHYRLAERRGLSLFAISSASLYLHSS